MLLHYSTLYIGKIFEHLTGNQYLHIIEEDSLLAICTKAPHCKAYIHTSLSSHDIYEHIEQFRIKQLTIRFTKRFTNVCLMLPVYT